MDTAVDSDCHRCGVTVPWIWRDGWRNASWVAGGHALRAMEVRERSSGLQVATARVFDPRAWRTIRPSFTELVDLVVQARLTARGCVCSPELLGFREKVTA